MKNQLAETAVKECPILFSTPMVQAILNGTKTQTRRAVKFPVKCPTHHISVNDCDEPVPATWCPLGKVGDVLWVRETWRIERTWNHGEPELRFHYQTDFSKLLPKELTSWAVEKRWERNYPSIHMPREACRLRLEITDIRVERLQDISEEDAIAEGIQKSFNYDPWKLANGGNTSSPIQAFKSLWQSINGADSWDKNPWVWAITFKVLEGGAS